MLSYNWNIEMSEVEVFDVDPEGRQYQIAILSDVFSEAQAAESAKEVYLEYLKYQVAQLAEFISTPEHIMFAADAYFAAEQEGISDE